MFLILNNDLGWTNIAEKSFQLTSVEDSDYISLLVQKKLMNYVRRLKQIVFICRNEENIVHNFSDGKKAKDFKKY